MLSIYLCGAVLVTAAAMMFPAAAPTPATVLLAGLLWPVIVVGVVQMIVIQVVATTIQARAAHDGSRPLNAMTLSSAGANASTGTAETWDRTTPVFSGSQ